jgi:hypothetical protein
MKKTRSTKSRDTVPLNYFFEFSKGFPLQDETNWRRFLLLTRNFDVFNSSFCVRLCFLIEPNRKCITYISRKTIVFLFFVFTNFWYGVYMFHAYYIFAQRNTFFVTKIYIFVKNFVKLNKYASNLLLKTKK